MAMTPTARILRNLAAKGPLWLAAAGIALTVAGCGGAPYVDSRREAGQTATVGASTPNRVAICYSSRSTTPEEVLKLAESECAKTDRVPEFSHQQTLACNLTAPTRAFFRCVTKP